MVAYKVCIDLGHPVGLPIGLPSRNSCRVAYRVAFHLGRSVRWLIGSPSSVDCEVSNYSKKLQSTPRRQPNTLPNADSKEVQGVLSSLKTSIG